jgi:hypothetical protein
MNTLILLLITANLQSISHSDSIRVKFDNESAQWATPPKNLNIGDNDIVEGEDERDGKLAFVRYDLNGDGKKEYFMRTLCGTGGCEYIIYDGKTLKEIGDVFGSPIWLLTITTHKLPIIESYSHQSAADGLLTRYAFDGKRYQQVYSNLISGTAVDSLFRILENIPSLE